LGLATKDAVLARGKASRDRA